MRYLSIAASMVLTFGLAVPVATATPVEGSAVDSDGQQLTTSQPEPVDVDPTAPSAYEIDLLTAPGVDGADAVTTSDFGYQLLTAPMETERFHVAGFVWQGADPHVVEIRTFSDGEWSEWYILDIENTGEGIPGTEPFIDAGSTAIQARANGAELPASFTLSLQTGDGLGGTVVEETGLDIVEEEPVTGTEEDPAINADDVVVEPSSYTEPAQTAGNVAEFSDLDLTSPAGVASFLANYQVGPATASTPATTSFQQVTTTPASSLFPSVLATGTVRAPSVMTREQWGGPKWSATWASQSTRIDGAIVHHTAGTNNYTEAQGPSIVKGIWNWHTYGRNWGDIGYNFLIDKYGNVYEGRAGSLDAAPGTTIVGAHAAPSNTNSLGVSVMGNYTGDVEPTRTELASLERVIAWQFADTNINPYGTRNTKRRVAGIDYEATINTIAGHKDVAQTACPANIYDDLATVRRNVRNLLTTAKEPERPTLSATYPNLSAVSTPARTGRLAGNSRYLTAVEVSKRQFADPSKAWRVYLVRGDVGVDAQVAGVLEDGPILLTPKDELHPAVADEIKRLNVKSIVVIGSENAVSDKTAQQGAAAAKERTGEGRIYRIGGRNRIDTAIKVSQYKFRPTDVNTVYVTGAFGSDGLGSPDAVVAGVVDDGPILLVNEEQGMSDAVRAEIARLNPNRVVQLGGNLKLTGADTPDAIYAGKNRMVTSAIIASQAQPNPRSVYLARGDVYADALAAGSLTDGPVLLVNNLGLTAQACNYLRSAKPSSVIAIGSSNVVPNALVTEAARCAGR